jgi:RNA-binding protein
MDDTHTPSGAGPAPTSRERRALVARGQRLKAQFTVGRQGLGEPFVAGVRDAFRNTDLLKVRVDADSAEETMGVATELAGRVPCHLVQRVGRVALLYRPATNAEE